MQRQAGPVAVAAWVLYDWSFGAFTTVVCTFVIATYVTQAVATDPASGASAWSGAQALAGLLIAIFAVPLGAVADRGSRRRAMLGVCTFVMVVATLGLSTVRPHAGDLPRALALVVVATVAFEIATVFYNAMLPGLARPGKLGRLSMLGWGAGYAGGLCCLSLCLLLLSRADALGLDGTRYEHVRACALLAGAWIALFGWPVSVFVPESGPRAPWSTAIRLGVTDLRRTWRDAITQPGLRNFVLARIFYTDGLIALFAFGGIFAAAEFQLDTTGVLLFGIRLTVAAGVGTLVFAFIEDRIGAKTTVLASVLALAGFGTAVLLVQDRAAFMWLATGLGLFVGPAQAASRSLMAQMAPPKACGSYFGLFALSGRVTGFMGPLALSLVTGLTGSLRAGMGVIVVFLLVGAVLLARVPYQARIPARRARVAV
jgi:UMF1 family MFS transporter